MDSIIYTLLSILILGQRAEPTQTCLSRCQILRGHTLNCSLNRPSHLLEEKHAISQLQCFDACVRMSGCQMYNFVQENNTCQMFRGLWSFDDEEKSLVTENGVVFSWIGRDIYRQYLGPNCQQNNLCQGQDPSVKEFCKKPMDLVFLLDISRSNEGELNLTKKFIIKVLESFELSSQLTKVGMVEYSTDASVKFFFNNFTSRDHFIRYLTEIQKVGGQTRYDKSLQKAESELFTVQGGARPFVHRAVVLITDNDLPLDVVDNSQHIKKALKKKCIHTFAVGIGEAAKRAADRVADSKAHLLKVELKDLLDKADLFAEKLCAVLG